jgi:hypothetical protein
MAAESFSARAQLDAEIESAVHNGERLLIDVRAFIGRFCIFPDMHCLTAVALWAAHAHMVQHFHTTPRLIMCSPEVSSGKTRVLEVLDLLVPNSMFALSASSASIFRMLQARQVTLLFDEVDTIWNKRGKDDAHEDLRALINSGYKRGATIPRCVGPRHEVVSFPTFCAVALAGLGDLPHTIVSRAVIIPMRPRAPDEILEQFRSRKQDPEGHALRQRLAEWASVVGSGAGRAEPTMPAGIVDRPAEVWEPLLAVAEAARGHWPASAREACRALCAVARDRRVSLGLRLLADLRTIFGNADALHTEVVIDRLTSGHGLEEDAPWADLHGKPVGKRGLASMLAKYGVRPVKVTVGGRSLQGYRREHLWEAWRRYLPPAPSAEPELPELPVSGNEKMVSEIPEIPEIPGIRADEGASALMEEFDL